LSTIFAVGNVESSKNLQLVACSGRFIVLGLMICGSIYVAIKYPNPNLNKIEFFNFDKIHIIFGNIVFISIFHHCISGLIYPFRP